MADAFDSLGFKEEEGDDFDSLGFVAETAPVAPRGPVRSQGDLRAFEQEQTRRGGPARRTLDERHTLRGQYEQEEDELFRSQNRLERDMAKRAFTAWMQATGGRLNPGETHDQSVAAWAAKNLPEFSDDAANLEGIRTRRTQLQEQSSKLGVGQTGRIIGSTIGGVAGAIGGGALGSFASPAGTVGGAIAGSAGGAGLGSYLGSQWDLAQAEDVTEAEASKLMRERVIEDVALDAAGSLIFFGGGKILKVTGASKALKDAATRFFADAGETAAAPVAKPRVKWSQPATEAAESAPQPAAKAASARVAQPAAKAASARVTDAGRYVIPGQEGLTARVLEAFPAGKHVSEKSASRTNQRITNDLVAQDLGLPAGTSITQETLSAVREKAGKAYAAVKALPGKIRADDDYKRALAEMREEIEVPDFVDLDIGKATLNRIRSLDVAEMSPKGLIQAAKKLRGEANALAAKGEKEAASAHRALAEELDDLLERSVPDQKLVADLRVARQRIAKSYDAERALTAPGEVDARKLGSLLKKRPLTGRMRQAAEFGATNRQFAQTPSQLGLDQGNLLADLMTAGVVGGAGYSGDPSLGIAGALGGYFTRRGGIAALKAIYNRASRQGNKEAARHAARLMALQQGAMTGAKAQLVKESAEALYRAGFLTDEGSD
jgi:hypothetical protein